MSRERWLALCLGPGLLVGLCYLVAGPARGSTSAPHPISTLPPLPVENAGLESACANKVSQYREVLPSDWEFLVRPPYVLAGDLPRSDLEAVYRRTIAPTARVLAINYFDRCPSEPLTVLLLSSSESYQQCTQRLGYGDREEYAGIYVRAERRLVLNVATGEGTVAHELTHALAHLDFPEMPEWFDEGLASLHEECEFSDDGLRLIGSPNWRGKLLRQSLAAEQLLPLAELLTKRFGRGSQGPLDYAQARYVCLYLQDRQLLGAFYRKCRTNIAVDPTGGWSLAAVLGQESIDAVDAEFRAWLAKAD